MAWECEDEPEVASEHDSESCLPMVWTRTDRSATSADRDSEKWGGLSPLDAVLARRASKRLSFKHGNNDAMMQRIASALEEQGFAHSLSKASSGSPAPLRALASDGSGVIRESFSDDEGEGVLPPAPRCTQQPQLISAQQRSLSGFSAPIPRSAVRRNSQLAFAEKRNSCVIVDWDDTIFPTTWVREDCGMLWREPMHRQLELGPRRNLIESLLGKLLTRLEDFFDQATAHANVFIVTLAKRPWVEMSVTNFMPELAKTVLHREDIKIIYAQEYAEGLNQQYARDEFMSNEEVKNFWSNVKGAAITKELDEFHNIYGASWKNVLSLGDSDFERFGTIAAGRNYMRRELGEDGKVLTTGATSEGISKDGHVMRLRTKTLKMLDEPTVEELTAEITLLCRWLPHMVQKDSGFDIELDSTEDNAALSAINKEITGEDEELSWKVLAGMEG